MDSIYEVRCGLFWKTHFEMKKYIFNPYCLPVTLRVSEVITCIKLTDYVRVCKVKLTRI